jgi:hypothetical protein
VGTDPRTLLNDREPFVVPNSVIQTADGKFQANNKVLNAQDYWTNYSSAVAEQLLDASYISCANFLSPTECQERGLRTHHPGISVGVTVETSFCGHRRQILMRILKPVHFGTAMCKDMSMVRSLHPQLWFQRKSDIITH